MLGVLRHSISVEDIKESRRGDWLQSNFLIGNDSFQPEATTSLDLSMGRELIAA